MKIALATLMFATISMGAGAPVIIHREATSADSFQQSLETIRSELEGVSPKSLVWEQFSTAVQSGKAYYQKDGPLALIRLFQAHGEGIFRKFTETQFYVDRHQLKSVFVSFAYFTESSSGRLEKTGTNPGELIDFASSPPRYWLRGATGWIQASPDDTRYQKTIEYYQREYSECLEKAEPKPGGKL